MARRILFLFLATAVTLGLAPGSYGRANAQSDCSTYQATGQTVCGTFLQYWNTHGSLAQQGYPISGQLHETSDTDGKTYTVQYFERAVFELHPENQPPNNVLLSLLGTFLYRQKYPAGAPGQQAATSNAYLFPQTGKTIGGRFREYWEQNGELAQQGYPISDEFQEKSDLDGKTYTVQYFERAVFESHPENQAPHDVLLSQLGTFRYKAKYGAIAQAPTPTPTATVAPANYDWTALTAKLQSYVPQTVKGLGFMVARNGQIIYAQAFGNQQVDSVLPIASSSKMPSASVIMSMVDQGLLDLDKPVGSYLAGKIDWPQDKAAITLRMMLNHTSGLAPNATCLVRPFLTLKECAQEIANAPLDFPPGTKFEYGGGGFQVAGYIAEVVSGQRWSDLFDRRMGKPLGLTTFNYGVGTNPQIAGSARSDLADYTKIEQMFLADGVYNSQRILSHAAIAEMETDQVAGVPKQYSPAGNALPGYSFGWWHTDPRLVLPRPAVPFGPELSDLGLFGSAPWIDLGLNYSAYLLIFSNTVTGAVIWNEVRPLVVEQIAGR
jgi:CubicO group peptidase (beta-lactamase class C family)